MPRGPISPATDTRPEWGDFTLTFKRGRVTFAQRNDVASTSTSGAYTIDVDDKSDAHNFHLTGQGVNRKTGAATRGTFTWRVRFAKGKVYTYRSDADPKLRGTVKAT